jgi:DNA-binding transcriptional LysR family regulator
VVDRGSLTAAAEHLGLTLSATSRSLGRLEAKLQTLLRAPRRLELTEDGSLLLAQARAILAAVDQAEEQLAARHSRPAGRLRWTRPRPSCCTCWCPFSPAFKPATPRCGWS